MSEQIPVIDPTVLEATKPVSGLTIQTPLQKGDRRLDLLRIDDDDRSEWHQCDGTILGWIRAGRGQIKYGPHERHSIEVHAGDFLRLPANSARRYVVGDEPLEVLALVDSGASITGIEPPVEEREIEKPEVVGPDGLVTTVRSSNLIRETPFPNAEVLLMRVRASGGAAAGWHHHGDNLYFGYAVDGPSETEYGLNGEAVARIEIGECFHVPPQLVHRDTNPTDETHTGIIWLSGGEPWVVNVDGPG